MSFEAWVSDTLRTIPYSTFFVIGVALAVNLVSNIVTKRKVNLEALRRVQREYSHYQKLLREAVRKGDLDRVEKLKRKYKPIQDQMLRLSAERMKASLYYMIPFILIFIWLTSFMGNNPVALSPYPFDLYLVRAVEPVNGAYGMNLVTWYILSSIGLGAVVSRLTGVQI